MPGTSSDTFFHQPVEGLSMRRRPRALSCKTAGAHHLSAGCIAEPRTASARPPPQQTWPSPCRSPTCLGRQADKGRNCTAGTLKSCSTAFRTAMDLVAMFLEVTWPMQAQSAKACVLTPCLGMGVLSANSMLTRKLLEREFCATHLHCSESSIFTCC